MIITLRSPVKLKSDYVITRAHTPPIVVRRKRKRPTETETAIGSPGIRRSRLGPLLVSQ